MFNYYKRNSYHSIAHMKFEDTKRDEYVNLGYMDEEKIATKDLEMHFIELPKFIKKNPEVKTKLEQWLWAISGKGDKVKMAEKANKDVKEAMNIVKEMSMSDEEWELYESRRLALLDYNTGMINAKNEGFEERRTKRCKGKAN